MSGDDRSEDSYINDVAPDVMGVLHRLSFFQKLDDHFCPIENPEKRVDCHAGSFEVSAGILRDLGMDLEDMEDVIALLNSKARAAIVRSSIMSSKKAA